VIVPVEFDPDEPASTEPIELPGMAVPAVPPDGPATLTVGLAFAMDSVCVAGVNVPDAAVIFGLPAWESP
jgi:hypothetical protein